MFPILFNLITDVVNSNPKILMLLSQTQKSLELITTETKSLNVFYSFIQESLEH